MCLCLRSNHLKSQILDFKSLPNLRKEPYFNVPKGVKNPLRPAWRVSIFRFIKPFYMKLRYAFVYLTAFVSVTLLFNACKDQGNKEPENKPTSSSDSDSLFLATSGSLAVNSPDEFSWTMFARICAKAQQQSKVGPNNVETNNAIWETWADDPTTYPSSPDTANPPVFGAVQKKGKVLESIQQQEFRRRLFLKNPQAHVTIAPSGSSEETRRNAASFNFIINNGLWYTQGLMAAFKKNVNGGTYNPLTFPIDAVEVKAVWKPITKDSMQYYHWNYDAQGNLYGMVAFHIMTKALPNWTWATWEWTGNAGRCDYMGCIDSFGVTPSYEAPNATLNQQYAPGTLTPQLLAIFKQFGLGDEWKNYRLKGAQIDWIDATGRTILLGNSVTEAGFVQSSSCITCHSNASFDSGGNFMPSVGFTNSGQSQNGAVNPANFWQNGSAPYGNLVYLPYDFVWGVLRVSPAK